MVRSESLGLRLPIIADEDVPDQVSSFMASRGHSVLLVREHFLPGTVDEVIARAASLHASLVVTWNRRHFKALAKRRRKNGGLSYPGMAVLTFSCPHPMGLTRIQELIEQIEAIYRIRVLVGGVRMIAEITETVLRFED